MSKNTSDQDENDQEEPLEEQGSEIAHVDARVPKVKKGQWEAFAKEHKFPSFTQFIRFAINEVV